MANINTFVESVDYEKIAMNALRSGKVSTRGTGYDVTDADVSARMNDIMAAFFTDTLTAWEHADIRRMAKVNGDPIPEFNAPHALKDTADDKEARKVFRKAGAYGWFKFVGMDVPEKLARRFDLAVTTVNKSKAGYLSGGVGSVAKSSSSYNRFLTLVLATFADRLTLPAEEDILGQGSHLANDRKVLEAKAEAKANKKK